MARTVSLWRPGAVVNRCPADLNERSAVAAQWIPAIPFPVESIGPMPYCMFGDTISGPGTSLNAPVLKSQRRGTPRGGLKITEAPESGSIKTFWPSEDYASDYCRPSAVSRLVTALKNIR
jgi:hypothetical protein